MRLFHLKKWYVDLITNERDITLYIYFIMTKIAGFSSGIVSAHLIRNDGFTLQASQKVKNHFIDQEKRILFDGNILENKNGSSTIHVDLNTIRADLQYYSIGDSWIPTDQGRLLLVKNNFLAWHVPQPSAKVQGTISIDSQTLKVEGYGYQDIVEMTIPPWRLPVTELLWGRAYIDPYTIVYDQVKMKDGGCLQYVLLQKRDEPLLNDNAFSIHTDPNDHETNISHNAFSLRLKQRQVLHESAISTNEFLKPKLKRNFLSKISGNPLERKIVSDAVLMIDGTQYSGTALHEHVVWNWPRRKR